MEGLRFIVIGRTEKFLHKINDVLNNAGFYVEFAENIDEALEKNRNDNFNIAVLDIVSPDFDCVEYMKKITGAGVFDYVLSVTDEKTKEKVINVADIDVCSYLNAPLDIKEFLLVINNIVKIAELKEEVSEKEKRLLHLDVINEIARKTLSCQDEETLLWDLARLIHEKLNLYNVNIFLIDESSERIVLKAFAGGFGEDLIVGYSLRMGEGISGWVAENRRSLVSGNVKDEPRRIQGFAFEEKVQSELAVPIINENSVLGVIHVESIEKDAFSSSDLVALEIVADQMSLAFENLRLSRELLESKMLSETINDSLPVSILILDQDFKIEYANHTFCEINNLKRTKEKSHC